MPRGPQYTDEELLDDLRELNERVSSTPPLKSDMNKYGDHGARTYQYRFGSWNEAVLKAGFEPRDPDDDFESRPNACPLCGYDDGYLDYHHWRYGEDELGCYLCRVCHDDVHGTDGKTENPDWLIHAVENLVEKHVNESAEETSPGDIVERYNLPDVDDLVEMALPDDS